MNKSFDEAEIWLKKMNQKLSKQKKTNLPTVVLCPPAVMIDYIDGLLMEGELEEIEKLHKDIEQIEEEKLEKLVNQLRIIQLGAQDCGQNGNGAFTGEISAKILKDCGCKYVILGHSERRLNNNESDEIVAKKTTIALQEELIPIICIGESKNQRENHQYQGFVIKQLENSLPKNLAINNLIIAYEPIWAIGNGITPTPAEIAEIANLISQELHKNKKIAQFKIIYGGSVNEQNANDILQIENINGLLVGGSSLDSKSFAKIIGINELK